jgi:hypothetical protein
MQRKNAPGPFPGFPLAAAALFVMLATGQAQWDITMPVMRIEKET